jgi:hypothetical protein
LVFTGPTGKPIWRGNFNKLVDWPELVRHLGVPGLHFHDLRHTGNTLAARTGASTRDLMARMGHDSAQAAMIYQHATSEADRAIAAALDAAVKADRKQARKAIKKSDAKATPAETRRKTGPEPTPAKRRRKARPDDGTAGAPAAVG